MKEGENVEEAKRSLPSHESGSAGCGPCGSGGVAVM